MLKTIVGVYKPTSGKIEKQGVIAPLLELGAGFDPNYSGKENIFLYGAILGYSREYIQSKYDEIVEFPNWGILSMCRLRTILPVCAPASVFHSNGR